MDGPDQVYRLNAIYRMDLFGGRRGESLARSGHAALDDVATPDPFEDLNDSDISDRERREAIARERWRRQGRA
jgi:hypothetical protein